MTEDDELDDQLDPVESAISFAIREAVRIQREADLAGIGLMTVRDAATYLATSTTTVRTLAKAGSIRSATIGDGLRFRRLWLDEWIDGGGGRIDRPNPRVPATTSAVVKAVRAAPRRAAPRERKPPSPKKPTGPVPAATAPDGLPLYLLRLDQWSRTGISHYGFDAKAPLCDRPSEPLRAVSVTTYSWNGRRDNANCRPCLDQAGHVLGRRIVDLGLNDITMRTVTSRGDSVSARNDGWHTGDGRTTWCGKTRDVWDLAFRSPGGSARRCEECHERSIYLNQLRARDPETILIPDPLYCRGVLVDPGVDADALIELVRRAPSVFDLRRARSTLQPPPPDDYDPFCAEYRGAEHLAGSKRPIGHYCGLTIVVAPDLRSQEARLVREVSEAVAWMTPLAKRAERRKTLRARWDRQAKGLKS